MSFLQSNINLWANMDEWNQSIIDNEERSKASGKEIESSLVEVSHERLINEYNKLKEAYLTLLGQYDTLKADHTSQLDSYDTLKREYAALLENQNNCHEDIEKYYNEDNKTEEDR